MKKLSQKHIDTVRQFTRYALVGVVNTLVTLIVIFLCKGVFHLNPWVSNAFGYVAGFINSFILNKTWVFKSNSKVIGEALRFCIGFLVCYGLQLLVTWQLTTQTSIGSLSWQLPGYTVSGYAVATLLGMVVYTLANFVFNRAVTFKSGCEKS